MATAVRRSVRSDPAAVRSEDSLAAGFAEGTSRQLVGLACRRERTHEVGPPAKRSEPRVRREQRVTAEACAGGALEGDDRLFVSAGARELAGEVIQPFSVGKAGGCNCRDDGGRLLATPLQQ